MKKVMEKILESLLPQILLRYQREDVTRAKPETVTPMEEISARAKGKKKKKTKKKKKKKMTESNRCDTVNEPQKATEEGWKVVQERKKRERKITSTGPQIPKILKATIAAQEAKNRVPKTQAVIIQPPSEGKTYAEVLNKAKATVDFNSLQITVVSMRKTKASGILLEVKGKEKADIYWHKS